MEMCLICPKTFPIRSKENLFEKHKIDWKESKGLCSVLRLGYFPYRAYFLKCLFCETCKTRIRNCSEKIKYRICGLAPERMIFEKNLADAKRAQLLDSGIDSDTQQGYDPFFQRDIRKLVIEEMTKRSKEVNEPQGDGLDLNNIHTDLTSFQNRFLNMLLELEILTSSIGRIMPLNDSSPDQSKEASSQPNYPPRTIEKVISSSNSHSAENSVRSYNCLGTHNQNQQTPCTPLLLNQIDSSHFSQAENAESGAVVLESIHEKQFAMDRTQNHTTCNIPFSIISEDRRVTGPEVQLSNDIMNYSDCSDKENYVPDTRVTRDHFLSHNFTEEVVLRASTGSIEESGNESDNDDLNSLICNQQSTIMTLFDHDIDCASNFQDFSELLTLDADNEPDPTKSTPDINLPISQFQNNSESSSVISTAPLIPSGTNGTSFPATHEDVLYPSDSEIKSEPLDHPEFNFHKTPEYNSWDTIVPYTPAYLHRDRQLSTDCSDDLYSSSESERRQNNDRRCKSKNYFLKNDAQLGSLGYASSVSSRSDISVRKRRIPADYYKGIQKLFTPDPKVTITKKHRHVNNRKRKVVKGYKTIAKNTSKRNIENETSVLKTKNVKKEKRKKNKKNAEKEVEKMPLKKVTQPAVESLTRKKTMLVNTSQESQSQHPEKMRKRKRESSPENDDDLNVLGEGESLIVRHKNDMLLRIEKISLFSIRRGYLLIEGAKVKLSRRSVRLVRKLKLAKEHTPLSVRLQMKRYSTSDAVTDSGSDISDLSEFNKRKKVPKRRKRNIGQRASTKNKYKDDLFNY